MHRCKKQIISLLLCLSIVLAICTDAISDELNRSSINIKPIADGLVVIVNSSQKTLDDVRFDCSQENNEIIVALPADEESPIPESLKRNQNIAKNGISFVMLSADMMQLKIVPKLKLRCNGMKMVNRFQRYVTYLYPAGRDLKILSADVKGFDFDGATPKSQVNGSISIKLNEPLGSIDLGDAVNAVDNTLSIKLNPKDFVGQDPLDNIPFARNLAVKSLLSDAGIHTLTFESIDDAVIAKVKAKLFKSPENDELRIDLTLMLSLYETGKKVYQNGNSRKALQYLDAAKSDPATSLVARMSSGTILWNDDNYKEAYKNFRELIDLDRGWEFPEARYYAAKAYYLTNNRLAFDLSAILKEYLRRCDRMKYSTCGEARELSDLVNEPAIKLDLITKPELKKLVARLADPRVNMSEVQKNVFHYWATWCPLCLEEMPKIMKYAVAHPNVAIYIISKNDSQKNILNTLLKAGAIRRSNIHYYIDTKDDIMLRQMVPLILANKEPVTPLPISVFMQREMPFYITDRLNWTETELSGVWRLKYKE